MPRVHFLNDGLHADVPAGTTLSLAAMQVEASLPFGCRAGTCGTCALTVVEGSLGLDPIGFVEEDTLAVCGADGPGRRLGCQIVLRETDVSVCW
jgi:ferredoxin